jgi:hypothetical protein
MLRSLIASTGRDSDNIDTGFYIGIALVNSEAETIKDMEIFLEYYPTWDELSDEEIRQREADTIDQVANTLQTYQDAGIEEFVIRFTAREPIRAASVDCSVH